MKRSMKISLAVSLASALFVIATTASAHDRVRGRIVQESYEMSPAKGYTPPEPHTLGGAFELIDHHGQTVTHETFSGQWKLVFFGFAGCRESCPPALVNISQVLEKLGQDIDRVQPLFIDVSMDEPDLKGLQQFVENFHPKLIGLAGDRAQIFDVVQKFKIRRSFKHAVQGAKETGPRMDHSTLVYLIDPNGTTRAYFYHELAADKMLAGIRRHLTAVTQR